MTLTVGFDASAATEGLRQLEQAIENFAARTVDLLEPVVELTEYAVSQAREMASSFQSLPGGMEAAPSLLSRVGEIGVDLAGNALGDAVTSMVSDAIQPLLVSLVKKALTPTTLGAFVIGTAGILAAGDIYKGLNGEDSVTLDIGNFLEENIPETFAVLRKVNAMVWANILLFFDAVINRAKAVATTIATKADSLWQELKEENVLSRTFNRGVDAAFGEGSAAAVFDTIHDVVVRPYDNGVAAGSAEIIGTAANALSSGFNRGVNAVLGENSVEAASDWIYDALIRPFDYGADAGTAVLLGTAVDSWRGVVRNTTVDIQNITVHTAAQSGHEVASALGEELRDVIAVQAGYVNEVE
ncbi:MAG: hypothetical protein LIP77_03545 [Planctomycetes bacterium]|nr:hypothetical protein [Planctomycetota bacterium]